MKLFRITLCLLACCGAFANTHGNSEQSDFGFVTSLFYSQKEVGKCHLAPHLDDKNPDRNILQVIISFKDNNEKTTETISFVQEKNTPSSKPFDTFINRDGTYTISYRAAPNAQAISGSQVLVKTQTQLLVDEDEKGAKIIDLSISTWEKQPSQSWMQTKSISCNKL